VTDACKMNNVPLMTKLVSAATEPGSVVTIQELLDVGLRRATKANATNVLSYVFKEGADVKVHIAALTLLWGDYSLPSRATLGILIAHGWNIDSCNHAFGSQPLLWIMLRYPELVEWCLSHGASVDLTVPQSNGLRPILERAAAVGNIQTFERLRKQGASLSQRILPEAVRSANIHSPKTGESPSATYELHLNMVRHLIDQIGIDVNIDSYWPGSLCSTPLSCIACHPKGDATQLI
jgi:hypothetical protein